MKPITTAHELKQIIKPNKLYSLKELRTIVTQSHRNKDIGNMKISAILDKVKPLLECENFYYYKKA